MIRYNSYSSPYVHIDKRIKTTIQLPKKIHHCHLMFVIADNSTMGTCAIIIRITNDNIIIIIPNE